MSLSLQEQLLAAGLVSEKKVRQTEQQQRQQQHQRRHAAPKPQSTAVIKPQLTAEQIAKRDRDQQLNRERQEKAARKARNAEIRQMVDQHRLPRIDSEDLFNFVYGRKIHRMAVDAERRAKLQSGELKIVRYAPGFAVVSAEVAARIAARDPTQVVDLHAAAPAQPDVDDAYKDFVVPDDLMW